MSNQEAIALLRNLEDSLDSYCELNEEGKTAFRMAIESLELFGNSEQLPSAQPEIVRCRDCVWHNKDINQCNRQVCAVMYADDFCSYGERRGEQDGKIN